MNDTTTQTDSARAARRNYIAFCGAATLVMAGIVAGTIAFLL